MFRSLDLLHGQLLKHIKKGYGLNAKQVRNWGVNDAKGWYNEVYNEV